MNSWITAVYLLIVGGLAVYGLLGLYTLAAYWKHRHDQFPCPTISDDALPTVTVQLPIYNEQFVVDRLLKAAVLLDYPRHKLQIQVIDDSTHATTQRARRLLQQYQRRGLDFQLVRRPHRTGYKAGALKHATRQATGEYIALFDADFQPDPQFLRQTIPHFLDRPALGMVQTRWGHLNANESPLTAAQAIALDKHFAMEQTVRHRADLFPKFNGAGGVWRRACLTAAGGWETDTVTEDLCLSTRAVLKGWRCLFLNEVVSPAELPASIVAYKNQQARWAKGSAQCLLKYGRKILTAHDQSWAARLYALLSMSAYATHLLVLLLLLLQIPLLLLDFRFSPRLLIFSVAGIGQPILFLMAQQVLYRDWPKRLRHFPTMLIIALGMGPSTVRAILESFFPGDHVFVRTPKRGEQSIATAHAVYRFSFDWIILVELGLALYALAGLGLALYKQNLGPTPFLLTCLFGFGYVAFLSIRELTVWSETAVLASDHS